MSGTSLSLDSNRTSARDGGSPPGRLLNHLQVESMFESREVTTVARSGGRNLKRNDVPSTSEYRT